MTITLYRRGKQKKVKGLMVDRIDCTPEAVERIIKKGWSRTPAEAYLPIPMPEPETEAEFEAALKEVDAELEELLELPEPKPKRKRKK